MRIGDKVRFLSEVGGGIVRGFQGKDIALVEGEDGFEIPMLIKECVVIQTDDYNIPLKNTSKSKVEDDEEEIEEEKPITYRAPEIRGNDVLNVFLAFVPHDIKSISTTGFDTYLVNDSNYFIDYLYLSVDGNNRMLRSRGTVKPNMKQHIEEFEKKDLNDMERVAVQLVAYKDDRVFLVKPVVSVDLKIDTVKFFKLHSFAENDFFNEPALVYEIIKDDEEVKNLSVSADDIKNAILSKEEALSNVPKKLLRKEYKAKNGIIEIDLHIDALLDDTTGMESSDMLNFQLDMFRKVLEEYKKNTGQKIVFIHGKGDGVLRKAILDELKRKYRTYQSQDASFREYGYGATMVTIK